MHLVIIGEAASHLPPEVRALAVGIPWDEVRAMRNFVAHAYFAVDLDMVWRTVTTDLQPFLTSLDALERKFDSPST